MLINVSHQLRTRLTALQMRLEEIALSDDPDVRTEAVAALDAAHIASARLNTVSDLLSHPQLEARDRWREVVTPVGTVRALRSAIEPVGESPILEVPSLGQHTDAVLREMGYSDQSLQALRDAHVIA